MAQDANQHFADAWEGVLRQARTGAMKDALQVSKEIERRLLFIQGSFFPTFKSMVIGADAAPSLGRDTPGWAPLTTRWIKRKKRFDFYRGLRGKGARGQSLEDYVSRVRASAIFGVPKATPELDVGGEVIGNVETISQPRFGRQIIRGRSKSTGRFVRVDDIKKAIASGIDVMPFPRLSKYGDLLDRRAGLAAALFPQQIAYKLTNPGGKERRPILANFIKWWTREKIMTVLRKRYGREGVRTDVF